jgi:hypothetical protein
VAYLEGERHECPRPTPPTLGGATFGSRNVFGLFVPVLMQAVFAVILGAIYSKGGTRFVTEAVLYCSFAVSALSGFVVFTRNWTSGARIVGGLFYCPVIVAILLAGVPDRVPDSVPFGAPKRSLGSGSLLSIDAVSTTCASTLFGAVRFDGF